MTEEKSTIHKDSFGNEIEVFPARRTKGGWESGIEITKNGNFVNGDIGLWFDENKELYDFDGAFGLDSSIIEAIRKAGFIVTTEMEEGSLN